MSEPGLVFIQYLIPLDMAFLNHQSWGGGSMTFPHHNFVVISPMIMKFGTAMKLDIFYTMVPKKYTMSLLLHNYDITACILADM